MNTANHIAIAAAITGFFALIQTCSAQAAGDDPVLALTPLQGVAFASGGERIVTYFLSENGQCRLYVTLAPEPNWDDPSTFTATKFETTIHAGEATRYVSPSGYEFEFECATDALAMNVKPLEQVASSTNP